LLLPGWQGIMLALNQYDRPFGGYELWLVVGFAIGAALMRGAGCAVNDIVDRDFDAQVARTALRPIPAGQISVKQAWAFVGGLSLISLCILLTMNLTSVLLGALSLGLVAAYPFMKRITWWPQAWLGITFNWGALVGWAAVAEPSAAMWLLWAGGIAWTLGYDTIYALQDIEDDAMAGIKSSARALGPRARAGVAAFYALALLLWAAALWLVAGQALAIAALLPLAVHLGWQVLHLADSSPANALRLFRANRLSGLLWAAACAAVGLA
jgi:4-hydroxybenzoate polyprenyltransferase